MTDAPPWLTDPSLDRLWTKTAEALERRSLEPTGTVMLDGLDRDGRHAVAPLVGRDVVKDRVRVELAPLDALLRQRSGIGGLRAVCEAMLDRKLVDRSAQRDAAAAAREAPLVAARAWLDAHPETAVRDWAEPWLASLRRAGAFRRVEDAAAVLVVALEILAFLTCEPRDISRNDLAAGHTGDAHALDDSAPLGQFVLRGLADVLDVEPPRTSAARRHLWERFGVATDSISSTCLSLGIVSAASPRHLTGWDLDRSPLRLPEGGTVFVCENPRVLEACAQRHGGDVPMVCTSGEPNLVTLRVLRDIRRSGASLLYHGDFDWAGIAIANRLIATVDVRAWRMDTEDYLAWARTDGPKLVGSVVVPSWSRTLGVAMQERGIGVHEESMLGVLLEDVAQMAVGR